MKARTEHLPVTKPPAPAPATQRAPGNDFPAGDVEPVALGGNQALKRLLAPSDLEPPGLPAGERQLDEPTRAVMESRFGEDFTDVRVHTGDAASAVAQAVQARAYTVGEDIVFGDREYAPQTVEGERLIAHELAHVVQQRRGSGTAAGEHATERDAHDAAVNAASGRAAPVRQRATPGTVQKAPLREVSAAKGGGVPSARDGVTVIDWTITAGDYDVVRAFGVPTDEDVAPKAWENTDATTLYVDPGTARRAGVIGLGRWREVRLTRGRPPTQPAPRPAARTSKPNAPQRKRPATPAAKAPQAPQPQQVQVQEVVISAGETAGGAEAPADADESPTKEVPAPADVADLIARHTDMLNLDENALGKTLLQRATAGDVSSTDATLDALGSTDRDDVSLAFVSQATNDQLQALAGTEAGRKLLLRLYDELTSGYLSEEESKQAERVLMARARHIDPRKFINPEQHATVIPYAGLGLTKLSSASLTVKRLPNGRIWVRSHMKPQDWKHAKRLPSAAFAAGQGQEFDPDEVVGVYMYDEGGKTIYVPAMFLLQLSNMEDAKAATMMGEAVFTGLTLGAGGGAAAGGEQAVARGGMWAARGLKALRVADTTATVVGVAGTLINDHRGLIIQHFGTHGEEFLKAWSTVERVIGIYGLARGAMGLGRTAIALRSSMKKWRAMQAEMKNLSAEERQTLDQIAGQTEKTLADIEQHAVAGQKGAKGKLPDDYDVEGWKAYYEQNPDAKRSLSAAAADDSTVFKPGEQAHPTVKTDIGGEDHVTSTIKPDGSVQVSYGEKTASIDLAAPAQGSPNNRKLMQELGVTEAQARQIMQDIRAQTPPAPKVLISFAQGRGNPKAFAQKALHDPAGFWESDAFERIPQGQTRAKARVGAGQHTLSEYALVFEESDPGQFQPKTSGTTPVTEFQHVDPKTGKRISGASVKPRAVVRVNDSGEIVEIVDDVMPGTPTERRASVIALLKQQGWVVRLEQ